MVERESIAMLDREGISAALFDSAPASPDLADAELLSILPEPGNFVFSGDDGTELNVQVFAGDLRQPHILYLPAEYETPESLGLLAVQFLKGGFTMLSLDYRGTGKSQGALGLAAIIHDLHPFFSSVQEWMRNEGRNGKLVLMGRSIGAALALHLASQVEDQLLCLVMESGFDRTLDFLAAKGVDISTLPADRRYFENRAAMASFGKPVFFIHSSRDTVQTLSQMEWLVAESRSKASQFQVAPAGTREELAMQVNDLYGQVLLQWINLRLGIRPARKKRGRRPGKKAATDLYLGYTRPWE